MQPTVRLAQLPSELRLLSSRNSIRTARPLSSTSRNGLLSRASGESFSRNGGILEQRRAMTVDQLDSGRDQRERVVVLGSGWAGYTVARALDSKKYQTVVVSPRSYFAFTPLLASASVGTLEFRTTLEPIRTRRTNVDFFQGWADAIDFKNKKVTIEEAVEDVSSSQALVEDRHAGETKAQRHEREQVGAKKGTCFDLTYDKLIVTVGCYSQTFGTPGIKEHALFLKDVGDARRIRNRILACFEAAALPTTTDEQQKELLNFAVVGGGPTGIEFSAELHDIIHEDLARIYPELIQFHKIAVYDVAKKVLPMFDEKLAQYAMDTFKREGIAVKTNHHVESLRPGSPREKGASADDHQVYTLKVKEEGEMGVGMVVWSTGLMQNPFVAKAMGGDNLYEVPKSFRRINDPSNDPDSLSWRVKTNAKTGSVLTDDRLRLKLVGEDGSDKKPEAILNDVYALGDCAIIEDTQYPATAQVASQKAYWLAKRLNKNDIEKAGFTYKNMGVMAYIGDWNALLQGGGSGGISGRLAWIIWRGAYLTKSVSIRNKILIPVYWAINWLFGRDISRF
ncbi:pyridine nucleotide-disulfide oxidoreductase-like protein [Bimuria novae-zelandiae CBS 107.79]|uniref:Pyridine nucleotide-disulfide oxidoreductase-like protein n=1 Tax=Bimuria novae-zelandiae CBS 107.79 TaxID=1447943 RepID=A0A6A5VXL2_9PLEO|nr:pyridine nucleotide-disulfide oxidoreductase-like protein [Bimuria novae-zelandiae CBS 107.79]